MNRRDFLKSLGVIGVAVPVAAIPALPVVQKIAGLDVIKRVDLQSRSTLRRFNDGRWTLEFVSEDSLSPDFKDELIIEIGKKEYILSKLTEIQISAEYLSGWTRSDKDYIHWITGNDWKKI